jgi:3-deoxy-manno-octulosonate cytidylyltransferase (CMP-KDO synthetase)
MRFLMNIIGIIPARLKSTRLPEKMLVKIKGKTLIEHVYNNAKKARCIRELYVATDSPKIRKVIEAAGGKAIMTSGKCGSGSERIREALKALKANSNDIVVNIQGDEPLLEPKLIDRVIKALIADRACDAATLASPLKDKKEIGDPSVVKVVINADSRAMYFSRAIIPYDRDGRGYNGSMLKHIGLYVYRKGILDRWPSLASRYEHIEKLEQLRMVENGCAVKVVVEKSRSIGVDTRKDIAKVKKLI